MNDKQEIQFWQKAIELLKAGYGANCEVSDLDDVHKKAIESENNSVSEIVTHRGRCFSCKAKEAILFIEQHIEAITY